MQAARAVARCALGAIVTLLLITSAAPAAAPSPVEHALQLEQEGKFAEARAELGSALSRTRAGTLEAADVLRLLGWMDYRLGNHEEATTRLQESVDIYRALLSPQDLRLAKALSNLGTVTRDRGDYNAAMQRFGEALASVGPERSPERDDMRAVVHNNLAGVLYYRGDFVGAASQWTQSKELFEALYGVESRETAQTLNNLGQVYIDVGAYERARPLLQQSLEIKERLYGSEQVAIASTVFNLGAVEEETGDSARARQLYARALAIYEKALGADHPNAAIVAQAIGALELRTGESAAALEPLERALRIRTRAFGPSSSWVAETLAILAEAQSAIARTATARASGVHAFALASISGEDELLWQVLQRCSAVLDDPEYRAAAVFFGKYAVNELQQARARLVDLGEPVQRSYLRKNASHYRALADRLITLGRLPEAEQVLDMLKEEEFFDSVRGGLKKDDAGGTRATFTVVEKPLQERLDRSLQAARAAFDAAPAEREAAADRVEHDANDAMAALRAKVASNKAPSRPATARLNDSKPSAQLPAAERGFALVRYLVAPTRVRILLRIGSEEWSRDADLSQPRLNAAVFDLRRALQNPTSDPKPQARALYDVLIAPVAQELRSHDVHTLLLVPDGTLRYLPFAALYDGREYLIARYAMLEVTPAAPASARAAASRSPRIAGLGVSKAVGNFAPLPRVTLELERIVQRDPTDRDGVLPGVVLLDESFSENALVDVWHARYPLVHIATHFVFSPGPLQESYLVLGNGARFTLDRMRQETRFLDGVQLLTLSACETAVGQPDSTGHEIESFGVLAQRQGARNVLATLWRVEDLSAATFMSHLYERYRSGDALPDALRAAQTTFASGRGSPYRHPYFWAAYSLIGAAD